MRWSSVVLILLAIQFSNCDPLTSAENEQRLNSCGKKVQSKVYMGRDAQQTEAPWSIFYLLYGKPDAKGARTATTCTGTIVSTRHILFATHCFADLNDVSWSPKDLPFDNNNCKGDHYEITNEELLKAIKIQSNGAKVAQHPEKITIVYGCIKRQANKTTPYPNVGPQYYVDDFAIIDLYEDLTFSETLGMVCVAESRAANVVNTVLDYFGFGLNPPKGQQEGKDNSGLLRHEKVKIRSDMPMEDYYFLAISVDSKTIACVGDSGGGSIGDINGKKTIVGVLSQTNCANPKDRDDKPFEQYASVGYYNDIICQLTGICNTSQEHDKYLPNNVRPVKPPRPTEAPIVTHQREIGQAQGAEPDGANEKSIHFIVALILVVFLV